MISEFALIDRLRKIIPPSLQGMDRLTDDAAILRGRGKERFLLASDVLVEGIDFVRKKLAPEWVGRKALAVNLSDIAAMGGKPVACLVSLGIPSNLNEAWLTRFYRGLSGLAKKYGVLVAGGDISRSREFFVSIAVFGTVLADQVVKRQGAKVGDWIAVTGNLGGSLRKHHYAFEPRLKEARFLAQRFRPNAMIDVSDGLIQDLEHILKLSKVGAHLELKHIPISPEAQRLSKGDKEKALRSALTEGEDFELLFTISNSKKMALELNWKKYFPKTKLSWIGRVTRKQGLVPRLNSSKTGYTHF